MLAKRLIYIEKPALTLACLVLGLALAGPAAAGELYKWTDEQGNVYYGDSPPDNAQLKKITGNVSSYGSVSVEPLPQSSDSVEGAGSARKVVMYSTSWCGFCNEAKRYFRAKGIPYRNYDIEKSERAAKAFKKINGRGVPVILVGKQRMNGFDVATFERIYYGNS